MQRLVILDTHDGPLTVEVGDARFTAHSAELTEVPSIPERFLSPVVDEYVLTFRVRPNENREQFRVLIDGHPVPRDVFLHQGKVGGQ